MQRRWNGPARQPDTCLRRRIARRLARASGDAREVRRGRLCRDAGGVPQGPHTGVFGTRPGGISGFFCGPPALKNSDFGCPGHFTKTGVAPQLHPKREIRLSRVPVAVARLRRRSARNGLDPDRAVCARLAAGLFPHDDCCRYATENGGLDRVVWPKCIRMADVPLHQCFQRVGSFWYTGVGKFLSTFRNRRLKGYV